MKLTEHRPRRVLHGRLRCLKPARLASIHHVITLNQTRKPAVPPLRLASHDLCRNSCNPKVLGKDHRGESVS